MQFDHALDRNLQEILLSDPDIEALYLIKVEISDGFYRISLNINDTPKLGVVLPTEKGQQPLIAIPLLLPMNWKNSPPIFTTAIKTTSDFANKRIRDSLHSPRPHHLDDEAENAPLPPADTPSNSFPKSAAALVTPPDRDHIPPLYLLQCYIDVFVDDLVCLVHGNKPKRRVQHILLHAINQAFLPLDIAKNKFCQETVSIKKSAKETAPSP